MKTVAQQLEDWATYEESAAASSTAQDYLATVTQAVDSLWGIFQADPETPSETDEAVASHVVWQHAAISTIGSEAGTHLEAPPRQEVSWGRRPVCTGMPRSPSRVWLMWTETSERPGLKHVPRFWTKVTIT